MYAHGLELLRRALSDPCAEFREGQWPAIAALVERRARLLVVQRTGWGKSLVYFLATKLLRERGHCISDWGHDFRPDYRRIARVLRALPPNVPLLATTATANQRVGEDVVEQLGPPLDVQRGPLARASLSLQNIRVGSQPERLAWLASLLPSLDRSGIVYTLTVLDAKRVAAWLRSQGIDAEPYYGDMESSQREQLEAIGAADGPITAAALGQRVNLSSGQIERILKFLTLESPAPVQKTAGGYVLNPVRWTMPVERIARITHLRQREQERMAAYMNHQGCLMEFLAAELDDPHARACGQCANCTGHGLSVTAPLELVQAAVEFVNRWEFPIHPRKQWPGGLADPEMRGRISADFQAEEGRALCRWGDPGYGALVRRGKQQDGPAWAQSTGSTGEAWRSSARVTALTKTVSSRTGSGRRVRGRASWSFPARPRASTATQGPARSVPEDMRWASLPRGWRERPRRDSTAPASSAIDSR